MILVTVEHTGTHRAIGFLKGEPWPVEEAEKPEGRFWFAHLYDERMPRILELAETNEILTTFRPWADVERSWVNRGRDLAELGRQRANYETILARRPYVLTMGHTWSRKPITF